MRAMEEGRVVLQLVVVLQIRTVSGRISAAVERSQHLDGGSGFIGADAVLPAVVLKTCFIHQRAVYGSLDRLDGIVSVEAAVAAVSRVEASNARVLNIGVGEGVAEGQRVGGV